jgi:hypothetical protein
MNATEEASAILIRIFESLARVNRKTLNARSREDIRRACELLANAGMEDQIDEHIYAARRRVLETRESVAALPARRSISPLHCACWMTFTVSPRMPRLTSNAR